MERRERANKKQDEGTCGKKVTHESRIPVNEVRHFCKHTHTHTHMGTVMMGICFKTVLFSAGWQRLCVGLQSIE